MTMAEDGYRWSRGQSDLTRSKAGAATRIVPTAHIPVERSFPDFRVGSAKTKRRRNEAGGVSFCFGSMSELRGGERSAR